MNNYSVPLESLIIAPGHNIETDNVIPYIKVNHTGNDVMLNFEIRTHLNGWIVDLNLPICVKRALDPNEMQKPIQYLCIIIS